MAIVLHGQPGSTSTGRALMCLFEADQEFRMAKIDLAAKEQKRPEYLALQPFGQVPVIQDGDLTLFESRAIIRHIANSKPDKGLYGSSTKDRALVDQWLEVESCEFAPWCAPLVKQVKQHKYRGVPLDPATMERGLSGLAHVLDVYEQRLCQSRYLAGDFFSIADLSHVPLLHVLIDIGETPSILTSRAFLDAWWKDISNRPSWKKVCALADEHWQSKAK